MDYEIDFLAVGNGERSGDAIALRFGNLKGLRAEQFVVVIDGGTKASGDRLVELIRGTYATDKVDLVISTHPDGDHASGLSVVLEELEVSELWMHQPWNHSAEICEMFHDGRITDESLDERIREALEHANELEGIAEKKGIPIREPFTGVTAGRFLKVLGPSRDYYQSLLPHFRDTPKPRAASLTAHGTWFSRATSAVMEAIKTVFESWNIETLSDPADDDTSAENNSSVVLLLNVDGNQVLFTADAGVPALTNAVTYSQALGVNLQSVPRIQVPHHGSKRNVEPAILNRILGPKLPTASDPRADKKSAIVSAAVEGSPKHPAKKVLNAFKRRGATVAVTRGTNLRWATIGAPARQGYSPASIEPLHSEVEE
jgi:beta-lactamase superfamily II metal-dependent hydrolase